MEKFYLEIDREQRFALIHALAHMLACSEGPSSDGHYLLLMRRLTEARPLPQASEPQPPTAVAVAASSTRAPATVTRQVATPAPAPPSDNEGELTIVVEACEQSKDGKVLVVTYKSRTRTGVTTKTVRCWDQAKWDEIWGNVGKLTTFFVKESKGYLNITGVKK